MSRLTSSASQGITVETLPEQTSRSGVESAGVQITVRPSSGGSRRISHASVQAEEGREPTERVLRMITLIGIRA